MKMIVYFTYISPRSLEEGEIVEDSRTHKSTCSYFQVNAQSGKEVDGLEEGEIVEDSETKDPATAANVSFKCFLKQSFADI